MAIILRDDFSGSGDLNPANWDDAVTNFYLGQTATHYMQQVGGYATAATTPPVGIPRRISTFDTHATGGTPDGNGPYGASFDGTTITIGKYFNQGGRGNYEEKRFLVDGTVVSGPTTTPFPFGGVLVSAVYNLNVGFGWTNPGPGAVGNFFLKAVPTGATILTSPVGGNITFTFLGGLYMADYIYGIAAGAGNHIPFLVKWNAPGGVPAGTFVGTTAIPSGDANNMKMGVCWETSKIFVLDTAVASGGPPPPGTPTMWQYSDSLALEHTWNAEDLPAVLLAHMLTQPHMFVVYRNILCYHLVDSGLSTAWAWQINPDFTFTVLGTLLQNTGGPDLQNAEIRLQNGLVLSDDGVISLDPIAPSDGKGEALTVLSAGIADQYIEAGINAVPGAVDVPAGDMLVGFRLTGGSGAIEGITVEFHPNPDGVTSAFFLSETHLGVQTFLATGNVNTSQVYVVRMEVVGTMLSCKVNGATFALVSTSVTQVGNGYFFLENQQLTGASDNRFNYIEYGTIPGGGGGTTAVNNVMVSGGGSPSASTSDFTIIEAGAAPAILFNLDVVGAGDGQHMQYVDRAAFTVGAQLVAPFVGAMGGIADASKFAYSTIIASPGQIWKVNGSSFTDDGTQVLTGGPVINPYPQLDASGNVYMTTHVGADMIVSKIRCSDLVVLQTLTIPNFVANSISSNWDGRAVDNGQGYLYIVGAISSVGQVAKVALASMSLTSMRPLAPDMLTANVLLVDGNFLYLGGSAPSGDGVIQKYDLMLNSVTANLTWVSAFEISCGTLDAANGKAYFGSLGTGKLGRLDLATFTIDVQASGFGALIRALAVDNTYLYAALAPAANGGATWWLARMNKDFSSPSYITDASWTGAPPVQGAKTLMII